MSCHKCVGAVPAAGLSRRAVLNRFGMGLGGIALANLVNPQSQMLGGAGAAGSRRARRAVPRSAQSQACHLPVHGRRAVADGDVRLQAGAEPAERRAAAGLGPPGAAAHRHVGQPGVAAARRVAVRVQPHGANGTWVSDLLPHTAKVVDDLCIVRSMYTEAINHDPAITFFQSGSQIAGRPSMGAWVHYGLGSDNEDLPAFVVLITPGKVDQPLYARLWGSGFLPSEHQGVQFRSGKDAVLYLGNPDGVSRESRRLLLDRLRELHAHAAEQLGDGEVDGRIAQYEMAYRMQASVPGVMDVANETEETFELYGPGREEARHVRRQLPAGPPARRARREVRAALPPGLGSARQPAARHRTAVPGDRSGQRRAPDRSQAARPARRHARRLGRRVRPDQLFAGQAHGHQLRPRSPSALLHRVDGRRRRRSPASSTARPTTSATTSIERPVHVHDFHATLLQLLGIDHERLTYLYQGRRFRLTDVHGKVVEDLLA